MSRTREAAQKRRAATRLLHRAQSQEGDDALEVGALAERYHCEADDLLRPQSPVTVVCGEIVSNTPDTAAREAIADTLSKPNQVSVDASIARTDLLVQVQSDVLALGVDAAHSIKAKNSLEKMLAHQMALLHSVSMRTMDRALLAKDGDRVGLLNATTRMMDVYQRGLLTIQRLRSGGTQRVEVKHLTVEPGGQAVIGNVRTGGSRPKRSARGVKPL